MIQKYDFIIFFFPTCTAKSERKSLVPCIMCISSYVFILPANKPQ